MSWFWRVVAALGGITFIGGGIDVATTEGCVSVDFGGTARSSTYSCVADHSGEMSVALAAAGMIVLGVLLTLPLILPVRRAIRAGRRQMALAEHDVEPVHQRAQPATYTPPAPKQLLSPTPSSAPAPPSPAAVVADVPIGTWRADPTGRYERRLWNGTWTEHVQSNSRQFEDPFD